MSFDGNLIEKVCEVFRSLMGMRKGWFGIVRKKEKREIYGVKVLLVGKGRAWFGIIVRKKKREKYMVLGTVWTVKQ